jgi:D-serine deaminase-like pyridoxal phosphate-dependent protein
MPIVASIRDDSLRLDVSHHPTPFARVDRSILQRNIESMQTWVASRHAQLRPHFKTHRSAYVADLQLRGGAAGFTCSDLAQLNALLALGVDDILISSPVQLDRASWPSLRRAAISERVTFSVCSQEAVDALAAALDGLAPARTWIEVDVGCHRTGVMAWCCAELATRAIRGGLDVCGLFSYPGQGYRPDASLHASAQERSELQMAYCALTAVGVDVCDISAGSSPTLPFAIPGFITEYRPGTYVLGDRQQVALGASDPQDVALSVTSTVLEYSGGRVVVDVGGKGLGRDAPPWVAGHGAIESLDGPIITRLYDHHAVVDAWPDTPPVPGERVAVYPNNANSCLALQSTALLADPNESCATVIELVHDT